MNRGRPPVIIQDSAGERIPSCRDLSASVQSHGEYEAGGRSKHVGGVRADGDNRLLEPPLTVIRQALGEQEIWVNSRILRLLGRRSALGESYGLAPV